MASTDREQIAADWAKRGFSCELWTDPPGQRWEDFRHATDEVVIVLEGEMEFEVEGEVHHPQAGEELFIPAGARSTRRGILAIKLLVGCMATDEEQSRHVLRLMTSRHRLAQRFPSTLCVLTAGECGAWAVRGSERWHAPGRPVQAVDTTAAGDTFIGFFLAALLSSESVGDALVRGNQAAAVSVTRPGAADSIPTHEQIVLDGATQK